jgi:hypothetical protein
VYQGRLPRKIRHYRFYRLSCGRDARLKQVRGDEAGGGEV